MARMKPGGGGRGRIPYDAAPRSTDNAGPRRRRPRLWLTLLLATLFAVLFAVPLALLAGAPVLPVFLISAATGLGAGFLIYLLAGWNAGWIEGVLAALEILGCFF